MTRTSQPELDVWVQGVRLRVRTAKGVEPTPFSLFIANMMRVGVSHELAVDAGAGGGLLAIALARLGMANVIGVERNACACEIFAENVRLNRVAQQVTVVHADIADYTTPTAASLVVANPPTIPERPGLPEFVAGAGPDGLQFLRLLFQRSLAWLAQDGEIQFVASSLVGRKRLAGLAAQDGWSLEPRGSELVPLRSFYGLVFGTRADGTIAPPQAQDRDGRIFHQNEIITVYRARREAKTRLGGRHTS